MVYKKGSVMCHIRYSFHICHIYVSASAVALLSSSVNVIMYRWKYGSIYRLKTEYDCLLNRSAVLPIMYYLFACFCRVNSNLIITFVILQHQNQLKQGETELEFFIYTILPIIY